MEAELSIGGWPGGHSIHHFPARYGKGNVFLIDMGDKSVVRLSVRRDYADVFVHIAPDNLLIIGVHKQPPRLMHPDNSLWPGTYAVDGECPEEQILMPVHESECCHP